MISIHLDKLLFFAFHGIHEEERILGNTYEVNVELAIDVNEKITRLEQTVNYAAVYELIKKRMNIPSALLETVAQDLAEDIHRYDQRIKNISVNLIKKYPPLAGIEGSVGVTCKKEF